MKLSYRWKRFLIRIRHVQARNQGDWVWLRSRPMPVAALNRDLWRWAEPNFNYYVLLALSGVISTFGLLANSSVTIIGAMIIAPLMGPITAIAFAMSMGNRRLLKRSSLTIATGVLMTVGIATLITWGVGLERLTPEIQSRVRPTLMDLGVALAAGAAGAFAKAHKLISDALPGVAISVALVPPLSVIGVGIAMPDQQVLTGSTLLFATNLASIVLSGAIVFLCLNYGSLYKARQGLTLSGLIILLLGLPLGFSFRDLILREQTRTQIFAILRQQTDDIGEFEIGNLTIQNSREILTVTLDISTAAGTFGEEQANQLHDRLEESLDRAIALDLRVTPVDRFQFSPNNSEAAE